MKNESLPEIDQAQHERLCAHVFGELQGAERAAFEAELLRSPALRRAQEQLEATVGLVQRAVPDEGLSAEVRRELLASARRSRFRLVPGRRMLQLVAACVVLAGGVLLLRQRSLGTGRVQEVRDGARIARVEPPTKLVERMADGKAERKAKAALALQGAAPAVESPSMEPVLDAFGDAVAAELPQDVGQQITLSSAMDRSKDGSSAATALEPLALLSSHAPAQNAPQLGVLQVAPQSGPASPGIAVRETGLSAGGPAGRSNLEERVSSYLEKGQFRGRGDSVPGAAGPSATVAPHAEGDHEELEGLGYVGHDTSATLEALGYGGEEESDTRQSTEKPPRRESRETDEDARAYELRGGQARMELERRAGAQATVKHEQVAAEVEQILGVCRVGAGESPGAMFFRYFGEAPFVATLEQRLSTFAADVDTASYALARAYLSRGQLPPREAVRTEEFVNYFQADQPPPTDGKPFALGLELAPSLFGGDARAEMLRVTVRGKDVADFERQPLALTFVIDNSGSMASGGRLELVKRALALLLRQLYASDSVAIVKFSGTAAVVSPMIQATRRAELEGLIAGLPTEGGTNVEAGLRLGYEQALASLQPRAVNRVILCSDGVGNIGETSAKGLLALVEEARRRGIYLNTVGVGMGNHNDAFLEELADEGDGVCHYVDSDTEAKRVFVDGLASTLQPIARDVKIQVELDPAQVESWRLLGYENRALRTQDFRNDAIDAGEVNAGHQVSALYELVRRPGTGAPLATVRLRYKPPFAIDAGKEGSAARAEAKQALELERTLSGSDARPGFAAATSGYQRAVLAAQLAEVLRQSVHARADSFATLLSESRRLARVLGDPDSTEFVTLLEQANPLLDARSKEETPTVQQLLDQLGRLHYEQALRERQRELARQAGEPEPSEEARHERERAAAETRETIRRLEAEVRAEIFRARGVEPEEPEEHERLDELGYSGDK